MMLMADKITTHQRFLKKAEKDLVQLFKDSEFKTFIERYYHYIGMSATDIRLEEMFYESLDALNEYEKMSDYALMKLNEGSGDYEMHMLELLKALIHQERYYEVINFSDHLMEENIPQGFRIDVAALRHQAKKAIDNKKAGALEPAEEKASEKLEVEDIDLENMSHQEILRMFSTFADEKNDKYEDFVLDALENISDKDIVTFMLLYLKEIGYNNKVKHFKFGKAEEVNPSELPILEEVPLISEVEPEVLDVLESQAPQIVSEATLLMTSHAIFNYPKNLEFSSEEMIEGYLVYILDLLNVDHSFSAKDRVYEWIVKMEQIVTSTKT
ncbi:hypothetical protein [Salinicoccus sp. Marseille-QA3877]